MIRRTGSFLLFAAAAAAAVRASAGFARRVCHRGRQDLRGHGRAVAGRAGSASGACAGPGPDRGQGRVSRIAPAPAAGTPAREFDWFTQIVFLVVIAGYVAGHPRRDGAAVPHSPGHAGDRHRHGHRARRGDVRGGPARTVQVRDRAVAGRVSNRSGRGAGVDPAAGRPVAGWRRGRAALPRAGQPGTACQGDDRTRRSGGIPGDGSRRRDGRRAGHRHDRAAAAGGVDSALALPGSTWTRPSLTATNSPPAAASVATG